MNRRLLLMATGSSLACAGCLTTGTLTGTTDCSDEHPSSPKSVDPAGEVLRRVRVTENRTSVDGIDTEVIPVVDAITTEHTAELWLRFTNETTSRDVQFGMRPPFSTTTDETGHWGLASEGTLDGRLGERCWAIEYGPGVDGALQYITLDRCESLTKRLYLWGIASDDDTECMPMGEFTFEQSYELPDGEATWEFTVSIE